MNGIILFKDVCQAYRCSEQLQESRHRESGSCFIDTENTYRLGSSNDQRTAIVPLHLPPQEMEILSGSGRVDDMHVDVCLTLDRLEGVVCQLSRRSMLGKDSYND